MSAPILDSSVLPRQVKVAFVLIFSFLLFPVVTLPEGFNFSGCPVDYILYFIKEIGLGVLLGYAIKLIFIGVQLSGQIIGLQMGLGMAEFFDPQVNWDMSVISQFKNTLAMMIFISFNAHYFCLKALVDSFALVPLGGLHLSSSLVREFTSMVGNIFAISLKAGVPVIVTLLLVQIVMGVINRVIPQINIFMISLPLKITVGIVMIGLSIPYFLYFLEGRFSSLYQNLILLVRIAGG